MKNRVLFILHLPPPVHGAAMVGKIIKESYPFNSLFDGTYINLSTSKTLTDIGKQGFSKIIAFITMIFKVLCNAALSKHKLCYLTLTSKGSGFYKDFIFVFILKLFCKKLVFHFHNKGVADYQHRFIDNILYRFTFRNAYVILLSPHLYPDIQKYVPENRVYYCANGIPASINFTSSTIKEPNTKPQLLFLSNMMEEKGAYDLLMACKILKDKGYDFACNFVGTWSDITENSFSERIQDLNLSEYVHYHGPKYGSDKDVFLQSSDVFVFPTYYHMECFPLVILEAMQCGLPVIASSEAAIPEIVADNKTGLLVQKKNPADLAAKIEILLNNPDLRKQMGKLGRKKFEEKYTVEVFENNFCKILTELSNKI